MRTKRSAKRAEGSMFILVLLVLLILTSVALGLVFVTEIEMQLGGTERVMAKTFYGAESGVHAAISGVPNQNWGGERVAFDEGFFAGGTDRKVGTRVVTSRIQAVGAPEYPPMSMANEGEGDYFSYSLVMRSVSERVVWPAVDKVPIYQDDLDLTTISPIPDPKEQEVVIQSQRRILVRYLISPIRTPANPGDAFNEKGRLKI